MTDAAQEDYRRSVTLAAGGAVTGLACAVCGRKVSHEKAQIVIGLPVDPGDSTKGTLPPQAFCAQHRDTHSHAELPKARKTYA